VALEPEKNSKQISELLDPRVAACYNLTQIGVGRRIGLIVAVSVRSGALVCSLLVVLAASHFEQFITVLLNKGGTG
jgi:hypothetical protein